MKKFKNSLLVLDGIINLILGILLLLFPAGMINILGLPKSNTHFYPTILGAVLFGIGIALFIERYEKERNIRGLGLGGAIAINLCGAIALLVWLLFGQFSIPLRGYITLWVVAMLVLGTGLIEIITKSYTKNNLPTNQSSGADSPPK